MGPMHGIWNKEERKIWEGRRICNKNEGSKWGGRSSTEKEPGGDENMLIEEEVK